jgi:hypothetical protein
MEINLHQLETFLRIRKETANGYLYITWRTHYLFVAGIIT